MLGILFLCLDACFAAVLLAPAFWFLNRRYFKNVRRTVWYFLMSVYLSGMYAAVGLPDIRYVRLDFHFNFVPFAYMFSDYRSTTLNVLLFLPLGFFLPVLWKRFKALGWTLLFGLGLSLFIELLQIFTLRATDVNDLMTNTFGTLMGWILGRIVLRFLPPPEENTHEIYAVCALSFGVMFFLHPFLSDAVLYLFF